MPAEGQHKNDLSFISRRRTKQMEEWPRWFKGEFAGSEKVDAEIRECLVDPDKRFRSEGLPLHRRELDQPCLWKLYIGTQGMSEEELSRGRKKDKEVIVIPINARRIVGTPVLGKDGKPSGEWSYDRIQYLDNKGRPTGKENIYEPLHFHDKGYLSFQDWLFARDQARKDLLWLNIAVLGNTKMTRAAHQVMCDQFIQKNFDGVYTPGYTLNAVQDAIGRQNRVPVRWFEDSKSYIPIPSELDEPNNYQRLMILLYPRAFFKSTMNRADAIQWMLNCPDISIMIMTAARDLAEQFVLDIKRAFYLAKGANPKPLHLLFPEYVLIGVDGTSSEDLVSPARRHDRPFPTLWADSIDSTLSGWHNDVTKFDDVVSNTNGLTDTTRKKLKDAIDNTFNLCDTWGKIDMLGTRYFPDDYYGKRIEMMREDPDAGGMKYLVGAAWYVKPEYLRIAKKNLRDLKEDMVTLTFPEHATFKYLRGMLVSNEQTFRCQQLNEPVFGENFSIYFNEVALRDAVINPEEAKRWRGDTVILWDTAKEAKKNSDYTVGVVMKIFQKEDGVVAVIVMEVVFDKWTQTQIADKIASLNQKWQPKECMVEDTGGLEAFKALVRARSIQLSGYPVHIYWKPVDNEDNAKRNRIKSLEILLNAKRLYFANGSWLEDINGVFPQLMQYTGEKSTRTRKDDIPDAMSFITRYLPSSAPLTPKEQEEKATREQLYFQALAADQHYKRMFGDRGPGYVPPPELPEPQQDPSPMGEIAGRLFGGNGMRA